MTGIEGRVCVDDANYRRGKSRIRCFRMSQQIGIGTKEMDEGHGMSRKVGTVWCIGRPPGCNLVEVSGSVWHFENLFKRHHALVQENARYSYAPNLLDVPLMESTTIMMQDGETHSSLEP